MKQMLPRSRGPRARGWRTTFAVCATALGLVACDTARGEKASENTTTSASSPRAERVVIRFSDPGNAGIFAYARREKILERELEKVGAGIEWVPAAGAFSANFEAMSSGAINASGGAISPIIGALAHNLKFRIYGISDPGGIRSAGILAPAGSSVHAVRDLVGKRVAVNLAAHGDYILLKALANDGVPADRVTRVPIQPPDAAAAFATGKIDAWSTFGVFYNTAVRNGAHVLARESDIGSDDVGVLAANVDVLERAPEAFRILLDVAASLSAEAHANPEKFQNVLAQKGPTAVSGEELRVAIEETRALPVFRVPGDADKARIANVARLFVDNQSIDRNITVDDIVFDIDAAIAKKASLRK